MRILDKEALQLDMTKLGFDTWSLEQFNKAIRSPYGMILITGPTGSGKTTTLYSAIHTINSPEINIMTAEDPVEYNLKGVNQVQINDEIGRTFQGALRSFLRQDPDVILVGETRDLETAQIAIRASLTGHLVLSTLHTNDCPSSVSRLLDMGVPPFLVASSLLLVLAQRLGRKVCRDCREPYDVDEESLVPYGHASRGLGRVSLYRGKGCQVCSFTGMKGRVAIYETMPVTPEIRDLILRNRGVSEIREIAQSQGMKDPPAERSRQGARRHHDARRGRARDAGVARGCSPGLIQRHRACHGSTAPGGPGGPSPLGSRVAGGRTIFPRLQRGHERVRGLLQTESAPRAPRMRGEEREARMTLTLVFLFAWTLVSILIAPGIGSLFVGRLGDRA